MIEHPRIITLFEKAYENAVFNLSYFERLRQRTAGLLEIDEVCPNEDPLIILSYGAFFRQLMLINWRTIEKQACATISHEVLHWVLFKEHNIKVCCAFDNIAESLREYGLW